ncbi:MAG: DUF2812 domain-containing protein [Oscillospiraceae bacterium]|nr:DUF2812 domain-containing protein [Oscillospiraceae bacterium]
MKYALETWNTESMERVFEEKARQGKYIKSSDCILPRYKKGKPRDLKFSVEYSDKKPSKDKIEMFDQCGWKYVTHSDFVTVWCNEDKNAEAIHTDKTVYAQLIKPLYLKMLFVILFYALCTMIFSTCCMMVGCKALSGLFMAAVDNILGPGLGFSRTNHWLISVLPDSSYNMILFGVLIISYIIVFRYMIAFIKGNEKMRDMLLSVSGGEDKVGIFTKAAMGFSKFFAGVSVVFYFITILLSFHDSGSGELFENEAINTYLADYPQVINADELIQSDEKCSKTVFYSKSFFGEMTEIKEIVLKDDVLIEWGDKRAFDFNSEYCIMLTEKMAEGIVDENVMLYKNMIDNGTTTDISSDYFDECIHTVKNATTSSYNSEGEEIMVYDHLLILRKDNYTATIFFSDTDTDHADYVKAVEEKWSQVLV